MRLKKILPFVAAGLIGAGIMAIGIASVEINSRAQAAEEPKESPMEYVGSFKSKNWGDYEVWNRKGAGLYCIIGPSRLACAR